MGKKIDKKKDAVKEALEVDKSKRIPKKLIYILGAVILAVLVSVFILLIAQERTKDIKDYTGSVTDEENVEIILKRIGTHILLPTDEKPVVATITDADSLIQEQSFYKDARNGYKVIIYSSKAIIYDPNNDILINVGPVILQDIEYGIKADN
ncbi:MAG: hypothetical protein GF349_05070 [Candidatus Magasanikbacteria bacterium]|nr:hypothetical protein [Candidatus Magasanikbacteria bacterium]